MQHKHLYKDSFFASIAVFAVMALFAYIPFNLKILDPLKQGLKDFEFTDIYFSKIQQKKGIDTNIVIVNIGYNNRLQLSQQIQTIKKYQPAVIGFDVLLRSKKDPFIDSLLENEINTTPNIVMAKMLAGEDKKKRFTTIDSSALNLQNKKWGFINFIGKDETYPVRYFKPTYTIAQQQHNSFAAEIVRLYQPQAYAKLLQRGKELETIYYSRTQKDYLVIDIMQLNEDSMDLNLLKGKIVLMGFLGPDTKTPVIEENRFTPKNNKFSGKAYPDMYGIVIHANIVSALLANNYVNKTPTWLTLLIAFVICWLHMLFFIKYYIKHHKFYHLVTKIIQLFTFILLVYFSFMSMSWWHIKIEMAAILGSVALSVDVLYFYDGFASWLHHKFGYKTVFGHH